MGVRWQAGEGDLEAIPPYREASDWPLAGAGLPSGTLAFLMTDIEGSTPLWEQHPAAMQIAVARHDAIVEELLPRYGGRQVKERGEGDSIFAVFASPSAALAAVCALQQALLAEPWPPEAPLRVRMGLHMGEVALRDGTYYGVAVNRTARIRALAHGGQILLSQALQDLLRDALPEGVELRPLGRHVLKGLERPEEIYQLCHPSLPATFPALPSPQVPQTNLPVQATSFVGREHEQGEVRALLGRAPLVTLTGVGGAGKTRLALHVAGEQLAEYPDGVWLVELAPLADPALVPRAVAGILGLREEPGRPLLATLVDSLRHRRLLLVLDNCEQLIGACADLATIVLQTCPHVRLLATSREGLEVAGEITYRVPSLDVPDLQELPALEQLSQCAAVQLFVERAQARRPDFALTALNAPSVSQICVRLDGIPLAIELGAARVGVLPVAQIAARLTDCFRLLTGGPRTALPRQQTLRATLDWSYDLLGEAERQLLRRLAVFAGGWTLEAAEAVCAGEGEMLDLLAQLVNKSLVQLAEREGEVRYRLLETVRQYGWERLEAAGEVAAMRERHLAWYLAMAERAEPALTGPEQGGWLARLEAEHDNLRAALGWCGGEEGVRLAAALSRFWEVHGHLGEGRRWLEAVLARGGAAVPEARARALSGAGNLAYNQGDYEGARALLEESLALVRDLGDRRGIGASLNRLGIVAHAQGDYERARALYEESLALFRDLGDSWGIATSLNSLGIVAADQRDYQRARSRHEESLTLRRDLGHRRGVAISLNNLGNVAHAQGDYERARALYEESLAICRDLGDRLVIASSLNSLGKVAHAQGDHERAQSLHEESLAIYLDLGDRRGIATVLGALGQLAVARGQPQRAATLFGSAEMLRETLGAPLEPGDRAAYAMAAATLHHTLHETTLATAWAAGRALPLEGAIALARER